MADTGVVATIDLDEINDKIKTLKATAAQAAAEVKNVGVQLRWDPKNVDLAAGKWKALTKQIGDTAYALKQFEELQKTTQAAIDELTQKQKTTGLTAEESETLTNSENTLKRIVSTVNNLTNSLVKLKAEARNRKEQVNTLREEEAATRQNAKETERARLKREAAARATRLQKEAEEQHKKQLEETEKATEAYIKRLDKMRSTFAKVETVILSVGRDLVRLTQSALEQGRELYNLSVRYNSNAEDIKRWNRTLELATGQNDLFTASLKRIVEGFASIGAGRGVEYKRALANIGLSYQDLSGLDTTQQFEAIIDRFGEMTDATARLSAARTLLGDEGVAIAQMFEKEGFDLDALKEKASNYAVVTQENAEKLTEMTFALGEAKSTMSVAAAEITVALAPAFEALGDLLKNLSKFISFVAKGFSGLGKGGQTLFVILLLLISVVPKWIIGFAKMQAATAMEKNELKQLETQANATKIAVGSIVTGGVGIVVSLAAGFLSAASAADEAKKSTEELNKALQDLEGAGSDYGANVESVTTSMSERSINVNVDMYGHGDTAISDEAAMNVAQLTIDELQRTMGDLVK